jgi:outer membrane protein
MGAGYWSQDPSGDIAYNPVSSADTLDIEDDLRYGKESRPFVRIKAEIPFFPNIYFMATPIEYEETGSKSADFTFGDRTFDIAASFDTMVQMNMYDIGLYYVLPLIKTATLNTLNLELGIGARIIDFAAEVSGRDAVTSELITESESEIIPVPMFYAGIQVNPLDYLSLEAEGRGIAYSSSHSYDLIGRVKVKPAGPLFIAVGYRIIDTEIDYSDVEASITFSGPYIEAGVSF